MNFERFQALTFDCYGTLIDWETGILWALRPWAIRSGLQLSDEELLGAYGEEESRLERALPKTPYPGILAGSFKALGARFGAAVAEEEARAFARSIRDWPPFPDSPAALASLKKRYRLAILSNVDRESFRYSNARLGVAFDLVVTAEDVGSYKPDLAHFHEALRRLSAMGVPEDRILHVAQSLYHDIAPAKALGLTTVWVNRRGDKAGGIVPGTRAKPDLTVPSLAALAERMAG